MQRFDRNTHLAVLSGPEDIAGIRKQARSLNGARTLTDLTPRKSKPALVWMNASVGENQLQRRHRVGRFALLRQPEIFLLANRESDLNRVQGGNRGYGVRHRANQIADLDLGRTSDAVDGRVQLREAEVYVRRLKRRLRGFDCSRRGLNLRLCRFNLCGRHLHLGFGGNIVLNRVIEILLGDSSLLGERRVAVFIELSLALNGLGARQLSLRLLVLRLRLCQLTVGLGKLPSGLVRRCLKRARIDPEEQLTLCDK